MAVLTFSSIDDADLVLLLQALQLWNLSSTLQKFIGNDGQSFTSRGAIIKALCSLSRQASELMPAGCELEVSQWLDFACETVLGELRETRDLEGRVFAPLHAELAQKTFIAGSAKPSMADWALFALLFSKVKAMIPTVAAKYYRLVRWINYLQYLFLQNRDVNPTTMNAETSVFVPTVFDMKAILAALSGTCCPPSAKGTEAPSKKAMNNAVSKKGNVPAESVHPFARVDLRVGRIVRIEKHPSADRLYVEHVDFGNNDERVVVSGLVEHVAIEDLQDRLCVFICNLKPAMLCKVLSSAMLLVAKEGEALEPLIPPSGAVPGDRIVISGVTPKPDAVIKPKESTWEDVRVVVKMKDGVAHYEEYPLTVTGKGPIISIKVPSGTVS